MRHELACGRTLVASMAFALALGAATPAAAQTPSTLATAPEAEAAPSGSRPAICLRQPNYPFCAQASEAAPPAPAAAATTTARPSPEPAAVAALAAAQARRIRQRAAARQQQQRVQQAVARSAPAQRRPASLPVARTTAQVAPVSRAPEPRPRLFFGLF